MKVIRFIGSIIWDGISKLFKEVLLFGAFALILGVFFGILALGLFGCAWIGNGNVPITGILMAIWVVTFLCGLIISSGDNPYWIFRYWLSKKYIAIKNYLDLKWYKANK